MKSDNSTFNGKRALRRALLEAAPFSPVVMETNGGVGKLYSACYREIDQGVVFERDAYKADILARQRPTWSVYQAEVVQALAAGAGAHLMINFLDCDPWGECWPILEAFLSSERPKPPALFIVATDGLRQKLKLNGGWSVTSLQKAVARWGNAQMYAHYLAICREIMEEKAGKAGYRLSRFGGRYATSNMTHFWAMLDFNQTESVGGRDA